MKSGKVIFVIIVMLATLGVSVFLGSEYFKSRPAGLRVNSNPLSKVYINGNFVGNTPYKGIDSPSQINLKLIPNDKNLPPYETKINLVGGIETVVSRTFGPTEEASDSQIISFDKVGGKNAGIVVITDPDNAEILVDGASQGSTPYNLNTITTGKHKVTIKSSGYADTTLDLKTVKGLRLTAFVKLAKGEVAGAKTQASPSPTSLPNIFVIIGKTPTGFLRMRTDPGTMGEEIAELKTGEKYKYLQMDEKTGWYKIQFKEPVAGLPEGMVGWVSNQYSSLSTPSASLVSPSPSPTESAKPSATPSF